MYRMTYKAILRGNRLEWRDERPEGLSPERELPVIVTILDEPESPGRGSRMAEALRRLADGIEMLLDSNIIIYRCC
jgi:hypothetical protein